MARADSMIVVEAARSTDPVDPGVASVDGQHSLREADGSFHSGSLDGVYTIRAL